VDDPRPLRVLVVVGAMNRGGVETWLMNVARSLAPADVQLTFLKHQQDPSAYDDEVVALGHRLVVCEWRGNPYAYARAFSRILRTEGPFDAVHSFVSNFSALPLLVARRAGVPVRIAHSQTDRRPSEAGARFLRRAYLATSRRLIMATMTCGLGCTAGACLSLFGLEPGEDPRIMWLPNGIDLGPFRCPATTLRQELGLDASRLVVGHVGRFVPVKNHAFILEIAKEALARRQEMAFVLVGDGPGRSGVQQQVERLGLQHHVHLLGLRSDIPSVLAGIDVLVLPSFHEGAPISVLEAQASGVPSLVSERVSRESDVLPELVQRLALDETPAAWLDRLLAMRDLRASAAEFQRRMAESPWNIDRVLEALRWHWTGGAAGAPAVRPRNGPS
jgi:glycosyltransferase involved in cell wall biosynthesis